MFHRQFAIFRLSARLHFVNFPCLSCHDLVVMSHPSLTGELLTTFVDAWFRNFGGRPVAVRELIKTALVDDAELYAILADALPALAERADPRLVALYLKSIEGSQHELDGSEYVLIRDNGATWRFVKIRATLAEMAASAA